MARRPDPDAGHYLSIDHHADVASAQQVHPEIWVDYDADERIVGVQMLGGVAREVGRAQAQTIRLLVSPLPANLEKLLRRLEAS